MKDLFVVTGGAGFIGRNIVAALNERGEENILIVDRLGHDEKWRNLVGLTFDDFIDIDDFRAGINSGALKDVRTVFHMGACSDTTETDADYLLDNNYSYSCDVCGWCIENDIRFIYASSAATYGDGRNGYCDDEQAMTRLVPLNMYGYSKHMFDLWARKNGLLPKIAGLKYFNVYGPYEDHKGEMRSVVNKAFAQIAQEGVVKLFKSYHPDYKDGEQVRDFVYVKDAVAQTLWLNDNPEVGGIFNCGTGIARTWVDLAKASFAAMDAEPRIEFIDMPEHLQPKYQYHTQADMSKIRSLGYDRAPTALEDGVQDYVQGYLQKL